MASPTIDPTVPMPIPSTQPTPPLENGDRLTRDEFERRYQAMPKGTKAELIEGVVYMPSPVRLEQHGEPHWDLVVWMGNYRMLTPGVRGGISSTIRLDLDNEPQPDGVLFYAGAKVHIDEDGYISGAPQLAGEITASTVSIDLNNKLNAYRRNEILEYLVWRVEDQAVDWFILRKGRYEHLPLSPDGYLKSEAFPGLWLDSAALLKGDLGRVHQVLQEGLNTPEHAAFVARLNEASR
jgi:hypothetical protein